MTPTPPDPKQPETSPERRFVQQRIVSPLIQWMPLGGSGFLFVGFLFKQEWLQVLLTFPVTVVTAVWAAYSKNFIERLSEIYAAKGKQDADALNNWLASLDEALKWQFSGFEAKYRRCQQLSCQDDAPVGVRKGDRIFTPLLQEVFVPLRLGIDTVAAGYGKQFPLLNPSDQLTPEDLDACRVMLIWDLLRQVKQNPAYRQLAIRAWGGYGKTTLLKHVAYTYGGWGYRKYRAPQLIPFLLFLSQCWSELPKFPLNDPLSLPNLLTTYHLPNLPQGNTLTPPPNWAYNLLRNGRALVMFDGFDEVPPGERETVSAWLSQQMRHYPDSVFILTSRPAAYREYYTAKQPTASFWVENFNDEQRQRFVEQWYLCQERYARGGRNTPDVQHRAKQKAAALLDQINARPELQAIAGNALLLNMMARFHRENEGIDLPNRKVELYQDICDMQLVRRPKARGISLLLNSLSQRQEVMQAIALTMMQRAKAPTPSHPDASHNDEGFKQIHQDDLLSLLTDLLKNREVDPNAFLKQIVEVSELMVEKERHTYEFAHLSFQEFLAAAEIARQQQETLIYGKLAIDAWKPTILLYADLVNPTQLIQTALKSSAQDLAYEIWRSSTKKRTNLTAAEQQDLERLAPTVQTSRYAQLEDYLKNEQWQAADQETYRLMITTVGKDEGQWFTPEELWNFDCEVLLVIDKLWVDYSKGHFGFSVQKKIYVQSGAKLNGKYPGQKIWDEFGFRVGWRKADGSWISQSEMIFNTLSSIGHLPKLRSGLGAKGEVSRPVLFFRIQICEMQKQLVLCQSLVDG